MANKSQTLSEVSIEASEVQEVHPLQKSYMFVSKKHVDYENLDAFESVAMSIVLFLTVLAGTVLSITIS